MHTALDIFRFAVFLVLPSEIVNIYRTEGCHTKSWKEFHKKCIGAIRFSLAALYDAKQEVMPPEVPIGYTRPH